jgi:hypothetical protein
MPTCAYNQKSTKWYTQGLGHVEPKRSQRITTLRCLGPGSMATASLVRYAPPSLKPLAPFPEMEGKARLASIPAFSGRRTHPSGKQRLHTATWSTRCCSQTPRHRCHERCSPMTGSPSTPTIQSVDRVNTVGANPSRHWPYFLPSLKSWFLV